MIRFAVVVFAGLLAGVLPPAAAVPEETAPACRSIADEAARIGAMPGHAAMAPSCWPSATAAASPNGS